MIIADTGFWIALFNRQDTYHILAKQCLPLLMEPLMTTLPVMTETCYLLQQQIGATYAVAFLRSRRQEVFNLFALDDRHLERMADLMLRYADLPMDFADASLVILAESLGHGRILTTDRRDFSVYRWRGNQMFNNLLLP